jgi:hypothetical protein
MTKINDDKIQGDVEIEDSEPAKLHIEDEEVRRAY